MKRLMIAATAAAMLAGRGENEAAKAKGMVERQVAVQAELAKTANPDIKLSALERWTAKNRRQRWNILTARSARFRRTRNGTCSRRPSKSY